MKKINQKIITLLGPTASGKSELAIKIALQLGSKQAKRKYNINGSEIISADSRQVYKDLNIGTGKVSGKWRIANSKSQIANDETHKFKSRQLAIDNLQHTFQYKNIPHHCIDFISPKKVFTAADFKKCAETAIKNITDRGKIPILCGGTGFYIDSVLYDLPIPNIPPNKKLRAKLSKKSTAELFRMLKKLDPERAKNIDQHNPRRLIRAIEIVKSTRKPVPPILWPDHKKPGAMHWKTLILGINPPQKELYKKIDKRLKLHLKQGMIQEVKNLLKKGVSHKRLQELGLEYRFISLYLQNNFTKQELVVELRHAIQQYAKRQITWFKRNKGIHWIKSKQKIEKRAIELSKKFLKIK